MSAVIYFSTLIQDYNHCRLHMCERCMQDSGKTRVTEAQVSEMHHTQHQHKAREHKLLVTCFWNCLSYENSTSLNMSSSKCMELIDLLVSILMCSFESLFPCACFLHKDSKITGFFFLQYTNHSANAELQLLYICTYWSLHLITVWWYVHSLK